MPPLGGVTLAAPTPPRQRSYLLLFQPFVMSGFLALVLYRTPLTSNTPATCRYAGPVRCSPSGPVEPRVSITVS